MKSQSVHLIADTERACGMRYGATAQRSDRFSQIGWTVLLDIRETSQQQSGMNKLTPGLGGYTSILGRERRLDCFSWPGVGPSLVPMYDTRIFIQAPYLKSSFFQYLDD